MSDPSNVKRYDMWYSCDVGCNSAMMEDDIGQYVKYDDYVKLENELKFALDSMQNTYHLVLSSAAEEEFLRKYGRIK